MCDNNFGLSDHPKILKLVREATYSFHRNVLQTLQALREYNETGLCSYPQVYPIHANDIALIVVGEVAMQKTNFLFKRDLLSFLVDQSLLIGIEALIRQIFIHGNRNLRQAAVFAQKIATDIAFAVATELKTIVCHYEMEDEMIQNKIQEAIRVHSGNQSFVNQIMHTERVVYEPKVCSKPTVEICSKPTVEICSKPTVEICFKPTMEICSKPMVEICSKPTEEIYSKPTVEICSKPTVEPTKPKLKAVKGKVQMKKMKYCRPTRNMVIQLRSGKRVSI